MRFLVALLSTLLVAPAAFADGDRPDPYGDGLLKFGAVAFTVGYAPISAAGTVLSALTHGDPGFGGPSFAPVVGPFVFAGNFMSYGHGDNASIILGTLSILDGVVQIAGIACMIAGGVHRHHVARASTVALSRP